MGEKTSQEEENPMISIQREEVQKGVSALFQVMEKNKQKQKHILFADEAEKIYIQVAAVRIPPQHNHILKISLPHSLVQGTSEICLFVKDLKRGLKVDSEPTLHFYQDLLQQKGVKTISKVIPLRQLKVEYKEFEIKRHLCNEFDIFLADDCIVRFLPNLLGKAFCMRKKLPFQINLRATDLQKELQKVLSKTHLPMSHKGGCSMAQVGHSKQSESEVVDNIMALTKVLERKYPGGLQNVRSLHIKLEKSMSIPVFMNMISLNKVHYAVKEPEDAHAVLASGELSTLNTGEVEVTSVGDFRVKGWQPDEEERLWIQSDASKKKILLEEDRKKLAKEGRDTKKGKRVSVKKNKKEKAENKSKIIKKEPVNEMYISDDDDEEEDVKAAESDYMKRLTEASQGGEKRKKDKNMAQRKSKRHATELEEDA